MVEADEVDGAGDSEVVPVSVGHQVSPLGLGVREEAQRDGCSSARPYLIPEGGMVSLARGEEPDVAERGLRGIGRPRLVAVDLDDGQRCLIGALVVGVPDVGLYDFAERLQDVVPPVEHVGHRLSGEVDSPSSEVLLDAVERKAVGRLHLGEVGDHADVAHQALSGLRHRALRFDHFRPVLVLLLPYLGLDDLDVVLRRDDLQFLRDDPVTHEDIVVRMRGMLYDLDPLELGGVADQVLRLLSLRGLALGGAELLDLLLRLADFLFELDVVEQMELDASVRAGVRLFGLAPEELLRPEGVEALQVVDQLQVLLMLLGKHPDLFVESRNLCLELFLGRLSLFVFHDIIIPRKGCLLNSLFIINY